MSRCDNAVRRALWGFVFGGQDREGWRRISNEIKRGYEDLWLIFKNL